LVNDDDTVGALCRGESVRNQNGRSSFEQAVERPLNNSL
jgi:hypothetical protein